MLRPDTIDLLIFFQKKKDFLYEYSIMVTTQKVPILYK